MKNVLINATEHREHDKDSRQHDKGLLSLQLNFSFKMVYKLIKDKSPISQKQNIYIIKSC